MATQDKNRKYSNEINSYFDEQISFNKLISDLRKTTKSEKSLMTKDFVLCMHEKLSVLLDEFPNWKQHRVDFSDDVKTENIAESCIDIFKYLLNVCIVNDITPEMFNDEFKRKSEVVRQKYKQEVADKVFQRDNIIVFDVDGCLAKYPSHFIEWVNKKLALSTPHYYTSLEEIKKTLKPPHYEELKDEYRNSGDKLMIPAYESAADVTKELAEMGYTIVILSTRPYSKYKRTFADLQSWLDKNNIYYDGILLGDKYEKLLHLTAKVKYAIEDDLDTAIALSEFEFTTFLLKKSYNKSTELPNNVIRVKNLFDVVRWIKIKQ